MPKNKKYEEKVSVPLETAAKEFLERKVKEGKFASIAHGVRYAIHELMKNEPDTE